MKRRRVLQALAGGLAVAGLLPAAAADRDYDDPREMYAILRGKPDLRLSIGGGDIAVFFADGAPGLDRARITAWIRRGATAVATYFGHFPVSHYGLLLVAAAGERIGSGMTYGYAGSASCIHVGRAAGDAAFHDDWVLVHEMIHLALPEIPRHSLWLQEGNATYVEPIARAQAGQLSAQAVWRWAVEDMPKGQPGPGDRGLDHTHAWGRTYWGGAMFWLLAEIAIYQKSQGRHLLQDALRAINRQSGGNTADWSVGQMLAAGDAATGVDALLPLYAGMKDRPIHVDLEGALRQLGIREQGGQILFDDSAPLARLRQLITRPPG